MIKNKLVRLVLLIVLVRVFYVVPIYHHFSLVEITRGIVGDLSITGLLTMVALGTVYFTTKKLKIRVLPKLVCVFLILVGVILYLSTFGYIGFDFYALGLHPNATVLISVFVVELCMWYFSRIFALIWLFALLAFYLKLEASTNLWDYMFDTILWLIAIDNLILSSPHIDADESNNVQLRASQDDMVVHNSIKF